MGDDYWAPVFAKLLEDLSFLRLLCHDTADADLLNWVLPNKPLALRCAKFIRRHKIVDRTSLINEVMDFAEDDQALRKIILFTWVEKNPKTMGFVSVAATPENIARLESGSYGKPGKIRILAKIDPRNGAERIYQQYFEKNPIKPSEAELAANSAATAAPPDKDFEAKLRDMTEMAMKAVKRSRELEGALETVKNDNRQLKKDLEAREKEVAELNRKLESSSVAAKSSAALIETLEKQLQQAKLRLAEVEKDLSRQTASPIKQANPPETRQLQEKCDELQIQAEKLQKALQNRDNSITRLESEKTELQKRLRGEEELQKRVERLQTDLKTVAADGSGAEKMVAGQLVTRVTAGKKHVWLFVSLTGNTFEIAEEIVKSSGVIAEELALLMLRPDNQPVSITSLESENRREIFGFIRHESDQNWLVSDEEERLQIFAPVDAGHLEKPVKAFYLGETSLREAGIYHFEALKLNEEKTFEITEVSVSALKKYFSAEIFDFDRFCNELGRLNVNFRFENDRIRFSRDYRQVLNGLRPALPVAAFCSEASCSEKAKMATLARGCRPGQACSFCGAFPLAGRASVNFEFKGERVLILGGDRVGSEYERVLARHNLVVTWLSGFSNLHELKNGLGKVDVVVIIVRQVSHTLLREIVPLAEKEKKPLLYCSQRGTSGVLSQLADFFSNLKK
ncbi:hypothetical protein MASR1M12_33750 [Erysipelotrichia bacterium]